MQTQTTKSDSRPTHDEIARRAQAIFEESGRVPGRDTQNWLQAEAQLLSARKKQEEAKNGSNASAKPPAKTPQQSSTSPPQSISQRS